MSDKNSLAVEEQALHEQEQGLTQMEAQLHAQEQGAAQMERAFQKKNKAILAFANHVREEEASLIRRAESMGPKAHRLVAERLASGESIDGDDSDVGKLAERQDLLARRRDLLSHRMALLEEREQLYSLRNEALEHSESTIADLEQRLVRRQSLVSEAARQVFTAQASLLEDDDEDPEPAPAASPQGLFRAPATNGDPQARLHSTADFAAVPSQAVRITEGPTIAGEKVRVVGGATEGEDGDDALGGTSRAEDKASGRRNARARAKTNQFKITLEAHLDLDEPHHFFVYRDDNPTDLPGLFIATPNILKVGREVRVRVGRSGKFLEATGIVAWQRQRGDTRGLPGMGIELLNLSEPEKKLVEKWVAERPPLTI